MRILLVIATLVAGAAEAQTTRYVTDSLRLEARSGPGLENRIVQMLASGTALEVLEERSGWSRVRLAGDEEGWILTRFLMDTPSARGQLASASSQLTAAKEQVAKLEGQLKQLRIENDELRGSGFALETKVETLATELAELKRTSAAAVALRDENRELKRRSEELEQRYQVLDQTYITLRHARSRDWFIAGAGVLLGGMVLGLIIPKLRFKRRRSWGEL